MVNLELEYEFEWDDSKERDNIRKHGVSFIQAITTFRDPDGIKLADTGHSAKEGRYYWVGKGDEGEIITTRFTERGSRIRIIGAGRWRKFRRYYEHAAKKK